METLMTLWAWILDNKLMAILIASAVVNVLCRVKSPEAWIALCEKVPRLAALLRLVRGLGIDPVKAINAIKELLSGKARVDPATATGNAKYVIEVAADVEAAIAKLEKLRAAAEAASAAVEKVSPADPEATPKE